MKTVFPIREGNSYLLNYSGIEIEGKLERVVWVSTPYFVFSITDPFTKEKRKQNFIRIDIIKPVASPGAAK